MLHNDHSEPDDTLTTSQHNVHIVSTESNEQDEIDFLMHQMLDPTYQYNLSPLSKQIEPSIIQSSAHDQIHVIKHNLSIMIQVDDRA